MTRPLAFGTGVVSLATLLAYGGRWSWACELLVNFRTHFALLLGLALLLAAVTRHWRIAGVAALALALNLWPMYGLYFDAASSPAADARPVRVLAFNVNVANGGLADIAAYLESQAPDVVVLEEMTTPSTDRLTSLLPSLPHRALAIDEGIRGVVILSRWPLIDPEFVKHEGRMFGVRADVDLGDRRLRLYGVHLNWPVVLKAASGRNAQLLALGRELAECRGACVVVGDFNTTPWSSHFRDLRKNSGLRDCAAGKGLLPTWPSGLPALLRIRIDHCLASTTVSVADVRIGRSVGSDHLATVNDLWVNGL
ncbi:MAG TPA: endonuclease/exonuclease/phosphatase family protein [Steroidobacteraceae bacterium]|nr:endonuclease/exonuclease/phosphatase family protein [Steroidobacteraceae bacterium]